MIRKANGQAIPCPIEKRLIVLEEHIVRKLDGRGKPSLFLFLGDGGLQLVQPLLCDLTPGRGEGGLSPTGRGRSLQIPAARP